MQVSQAPPANQSLVEVGPGNGDQQVERPVRPMPAPVEAVAVEAPVAPRPDRVVRRLTKLVHRLEQLVASLEQAAQEPGDDRRVARRVSRQLDKIERAMSHALRAVAGKLGRSAPESDRPGDVRDAGHDRHVGRALRKIHQAFRLELEQASGTAAATEPVDAGRLIASTREAFDRVVANLRSVLEELEAPERPQAVAAADGARSVRVEFDLQLTYTGTAVEPGGAPAATPEGAADSPLAALLRGLGEQFESLVGGLGAELAGGATTLDLRMHLAVELYQSTTLVVGTEPTGLEVDATT